MAKKNAEIFEGFPTPAEASRRARAALARIEAARKSDGAKATEFARTSKAPKTGASALAVRTGNKKGKK